MQPEKVVKFMSLVFNDLVSHVADRITRIVKLHEETPVHTGLWLGDGLADGDTVHR